MLPFKLSSQDLISKCLKPNQLALTKLLNDTKGTTDIDSDFEPGKPEVRITINRESAQRLGITAKEISNALNAAYSSDSAISNFEQEGRQFDITLRTSDQYRQTIDDLKRIQIQSASGDLISLDGLVNLDVTQGTASINRFDRERKILVTSNLDGAPLDAIVKMIDTKLPAILGREFSLSLYRRYRTNAGNDGGLWIYGGTRSHFDLSDPCRTL